MGMAEGGCRRTCKVWEERNPEAVGNGAGGQYQYHTDFALRTKFGSQPSCYCVTLLDSLHLSRPPWTLQALAESNEALSVEWPDW